jgi:hypothetical protein
LHPVEAVMSHAPGIDGRIHYIVGPVATTVCTTCLFLLHPP